MTIILKGKDVAEHICENLKQQVISLRSRNIEPTLAIVRVGEDPADLAYERGATKRAELVGVNIKSIVLDNDVSQDKLFDEINRLNIDDSVHGILLFRPLPKHIDDACVRNVIVPSKDVDGITDIAMAGIYSNAKLGYPPCTAEACIEILKYYNISIESKNVVVVGRSLVIGKPVTMMLIKENATVTVCHTRTKDIHEITKNADIIVAAAGSPHMILRDYVSKETVIVDVGINFDDNGKMIGDVAFDDVVDNVMAITPVPGGVGAVTSTMLMKHVVDSANTKTS
ncbi:MAG: bifunctional 5,10-methylenetetrahydrofolate dehydrogenase/5,10-methenyltetrahydrofolate cyclohydrolase [Eubacteriales bacterium]|nr:bifunctional 5,10-methylenetetrahydrofolate dehydrogenase/5,10-methenyltetrahydrofolate cyclohydrolase [Eubacteriales bacterium]MDY3333028.1 bifunctional 5,10-methylenetetrahydrofolate dehydrogenase/5,10-methenyltetrahydrofolate cyclohydrolase [Gallibacter sp.]